MKLPDPNFEVLKLFYHFGHLKINYFRNSCEKRKLNIFCKLFIKIFFIKKLFAFVAWLCYVSNFPEYKIKSQYWQLNFNLKKSPKNIEFFLTWVPKKLKFLFWLIYKFSEINICTYNKWKKRCTIKSSFKLKFLMKYFLNSLEHKMKVSIKIKSLIDNVIQILFLLFVFIKIGR